MKIIFRGGIHKMSDDILGEIESDFVPERGDDVSSMLDTDRIAIVRSRDVVSSNTIIIWVNLY